MGRARRRKATSSGTLICLFLFGIFWGIMIGGLAVSIGVNRQLDRIREQQPQLEDYVKLTPYKEEF